ncbi:hypothetical protein G4H71_14950 [Rhodococcus triatomae]|uniref:Uncharacterized protein n=1 Tax=Rhodococcus triatomae TaxID=300028 RepID=A0A1G8RKR9_9NOCA|nr:hypothetical protein [Rhodococcus triatomae]QNG19930.1 hypothetical protein G4H72_15425 [Rhodococcus triatomae]QNG24155.1 hypothetical protein G4H71_14950 [Rhodococcus triatomae]SDJ16960.1 hypothetical protein SAMN05444695_11811 [Rhodococcus triatomae]
MTDTEKRWYDPNTVRSASIYAISVIVVALLAMGAILAWVGMDDTQCPPDSGFVCDDTQQLLLALVPAGILLVGTIGGFVRTYLVWRDGGRWPIWQAAGWVLMVSTLLYITMSASVLMN